MNNEQRWGFTAKEAEGRGGVCSMGILPMGAAVQQIAFSV